MLSSGVVHKLNLCRSRISFLSDGFQPPIQRDIRNFVFRIDSVDVESYTAWIESSWKCPDFGLKGRLINKS